MSTSGLNDKVFNKVSSYDEIETQILSKMGPNFEIILVVCQ